METIYRKVIEIIDKQQQRYIRSVKENKSLSKGVDAILTATTLLKMEINNLPDPTSQLQKDKEELIEGLKSVIPALRYFDSKREEIESLIQKHNP